MSALAVLKRETRTGRWPAFMFASRKTLACISIFIAYQAGRLLGFS